MKTLLICPAERQNVAALAETAPLATAPILGKALIEYWLEHLVTSGVKEAVILASDRPESILLHVGDGARWGLRAEVFHERRELSPGEACSKYPELGQNAAATGEWPANAPPRVLLMDCLPRQPEFPLFTSYAAWFAAVMNWLPRAATTPDRIGVQAIIPGVWLGRRTRVAPDADLRAPCWIGENVFIGAGAVIGPGAVVEDRSFIEEGVRISESVIGPETFVGGFAEIRRSIAWGSTLVNWERDSSLKVPDAFLLSPLKPPAPSLARPLQPLSIETGQDWPWKFSAKTEP